MSNVRFKPEATVTRGLGRWAKRLRAFDDEDACLAHEAGGITPDVCFVLSRDTRTQVSQSRAAYGGQEKG